MYKVMLIDDEESLHMAIRIAHEERLRVLRGH